MINVYMNNQALFKNNKSDSIFTNRILFCCIKIKLDILGINFELQNQSEIIISEPKIYFQNMSLCFD